MSGLREGWNEVSPGHPAPGETGIMLVEHARFVKEPTDAPPTGVAVLPDGSGPVGEIGRAHV